MINHILIAASTVLGAIAGVTTMTAISYFISDRWFFWHDVRCLVIPPVVSWVLLLTVITTAFWIN